MRDGLFEKSRSTGEFFEKSRNTKLTKRAGKRKLKVALVQIRNFGKAHHKQW